jgi:hypothetical protein
MSLVQIFNKFRTILISVTSLIIIYLGIQLKSTYPFYLDYYNELTGGSSRVFNNNILPIGFWGQGTLEVLKSLDKWVEKGDSVGLYTILMPEHLLTAFLPEEVGGVYKIDKNSLFQTDWLLQQSVFAKNGDTVPEYYTLIHTFYSTNGAPLFYLYKNTQ